MQLEKNGHSSAAKSPKSHNVVSYQMDYNHMVPHDITFSCTYIQTTLYCIDIDKHSIQYSVFIVLLGHGTSDLHHHWVSEQEYSVLVAKSESSQKMLTHSNQYVFLTAFQLWSQIRAHLGFKLPSRHHNF